MPGIHMGTEEIAGILPYDASFCFVNEANLGSTMVEAQWEATDLLGGTIPFDLRNSSSGSVEFDVISNWPGFGHESVVPETMGLEALVKATELLRPDRPTPTFAAVTSVQWHRRLKPGIIGFIDINFAEENLITEGSIQVFDNDTAKYQPAMTVKGMILKPENNSMSSSLAVEAGVQAAMLKLISDNPDQPAPTLAELTRVSTRRNIPFGERLVTTVRKINDGAHEKAAHVVIKSYEDDETVLNANILFARPAA